MNSFCAAAAIRIYKAGRCRAVGGEVAEADEGEDRDGDRTFCRTKSD